ncbi:MAG: hypothetical protein AB8C02_01575 [Halioglobus sp.]
MNKPQHTTSQGKVSWVEFLRSIRFDQNKARNKKAKTSGECSSHFASFDQRAPGVGITAEDQFLVRSAN